MYGVKGEHPGLLTAWVSCVHMILIASPQIIRHSSSVRLAAVISQPHSPLPTTYTSPLPTTLLLIGVKSTN